MEEFLHPMELTQRDLADAIHVPYQCVNDIVNSRRSVTPSIALRLAKFFNRYADFGWISSSTGRYILHSKLRAQSWKQLSPCLLHDTFDGRKWSAGSISGYISNTYPKRQAGTRINKIQNELVINTHRMKRSSRIQWTCRLVSIADTSENFSFVLSPCFR